MNAVVAGYDREHGYVFKCPVCGRLLYDKPWFCQNCKAVIESYRTDMFSTIENPKVMVDLHGVVLDMCGALRDYFAARGQVFDPDRVTDYDFGCDTGVSQVDVFQALKDPELYMLVQKYPDVDEAMALLRTRVQPKLYSTSVASPEIMQRTKSQIAGLGLTGQLLTDKKPCIYDANVLFDDCAAVHRQWFSAGFGGLQYIIDRPYNQPKGYEPVWDRVIRVKSLYNGVVDMFHRFGWPIERRCSS